MDGNINTAKLLPVIASLDLTWKRIFVLITQYTVLSPLILVFIRVCQLFQIVRTEEWNTNIYLFYLYIYFKALFSGQVFDLLLREHFPHARDRSAQTSVETSARHDVTCLASYKNTWVFSSDPEAAVITSAQRVTQHAGHVQSISEWNIREKCIELMCDPSCHRSCSPVVWGVISSVSIC